MPRMLVLSILCVYGRLESGRGLNATACLMACGYGLLVHGWRFAEVKCAMHGDNKSINSVSVACLPQLCDMKPCICREGHLSI